MNFVSVTSSSEQKIPNLIGFAALGANNNPVSSASTSTTGGLGVKPPDFDALSLFDDIDFSDKPKEISDCLDDLADLIEEKSVKPMLAAVAPANMMMVTTSNQASVSLRLSDSERRRNDAVSLLTSLSVPDPLLNQLVLESMTGFIFVVDAQGLVEFVSESSAENVGHAPSQIQGKAIYNFLHPADHSRFGCHLVAQQSPPTNNTDPDKARRNFTCRFKLQAPAASNAGSNEAYITLYVACITVRRDQESAETSRLLCVARKLSDVSPHPATVITNNFQVGSGTVSVNNSSSSAIIANATDLFTTKLDPATFKVMHADTSPGANSNSRLRASVAAKTLSMVGKCFLDFCHPEDRDVVRAHFLSTVRDKQNVSRVYRMTGLLGHNNGSIHQRLNNVVHVQTKSKYHKVNNSGFILSIHSIVGDVPSPGVMLSTAMSTIASAPKLSTLLSSPPSSTMTSATQSRSLKSPISHSSSSSSPSSSGDNSEEAKNQLLKQLLNSNFTPQASESDTSIMKLLNQNNLKRAANAPLENPPASKAPSVVCSENPSLTELLEKPPHLSITVPPPVPTKWHQEPREKLPKDIMRKFLPPHPAERAAAAAAAAAAATATTHKPETSALYSVLTSSVRGGRSSNAMVYTSNSGHAETMTSASTR